MTARPTPAQRLLAMLDDTEKVESLPMPEVQADLAALGVDAGRAIAFAKSLTASRGSPAAQLLDAIDDAEDADEEIARLERAEIRDIVRQVPKGRATGLAGKVRRTLGGESKIVGIGPRRRRRSILMWGGSGGGIAASLFVAMILVRGDRPDDNSQLETYLTRSPSSAAVGLADPQADMAAESSEQGYGVLQERGATPAPPSSDALAERERFAGDSAIASKPAANLFGGKQGAAPAAERTAAPQSDSIAALLLVDPAQVPKQLQTQSLPAGGLAGRLEEARRIAGDRPVIALFTVESAAGAQDYALVPAAPRRSSRPQLPPPLLGQLLAQDAKNYGLIPLPAP